MVSVCGCVVYLSLSWLNRLTTVLTADSWLSSIKFRVVLTRYCVRECARSLTRRSKTERPPDKSRAGAKESSFLKRQARTVSAITPHRNYRKYRNYCSTHVAHESLESLT